MKNWDEQIDKTTQNFIETFGELSFKQLNWKPNAKTWSIAQNIDHIIITNKTYFPIINSIREGAYKTPWWGKLPFITSFFGNTVLKAVEPNRKKRMKTFSIWEPTKSEIPMGILDRFMKHQSKLKNIIKKSKDLLGQGIVISSPANKYIVYRLETAFEIMVAHEQRHFEQAKEVYQKITKKSTAHEV